VLLGWVGMWSDPGLWSGYWSVTWDIGLWIIPHPMILVYICGFSFDHGFDCGLLTVGFDHGFGLWLGPWLGPWFGPWLGLWVWRMDPGDNSGDAGDWVISWDNYMVW